MAQTWQVTLNMENQRLGVEAEPAAEGTQCRNRHESLVVYVQMCV